MSAIRYMWTATGLRPSELEHGAMRYVRETDYDELVAALKEILWHVDGREDITNDGTPNLAMSIGVIARAALAKAEA